MTSELRVDKIVPVDGVPSGSGYMANGGGGIIQIVYGSTFSQASRTHGNIPGTETFTFDTNLSATITPKFSTSKIFVQAFQNYSFVNNSSAEMQGNLYICDGSNNILDGRDQDYDMLRVKNMTAFAAICPLQLLHSPNTTSAFTYKIRANFYYCGGGSSGQMIFQNGNRNNAVSTISLMDVSA